REISHLGLIVESGAALSPNHAVGETLRCCDEAARPSSPRMLWVTPPSPKNCQVKAGNLCIRSALQCGVERWATCHARLSHRSLWLDRVRRLGAALSGWPCANRLRPLGPG